MPKKAGEEGNEPKGPEHGDPLEPADPKPAEGEKVEGEEGEAEVKDPVEFMRGQLQSLQEELRDLRASRNAREPAPKPQPKEEDPEPDWDKMLFDKPKEAVAEIRRRVKDEIRAELTSSYQNDRNQQQFWSGFYESNPDLKSDKDLVEITLQANLKTLGDMPVEKAAERLGELTRERILRYAKTTNTEPGKKKVQAEGANSPAPRKKAAEPPKPVTLSEIIRSRRAAHTAPPPGNRGSAA